MFKRLSIISAVLIAALVVIAIPAGAATGGVSAHKHHKHWKTEPAKPLESGEYLAAEGMEVFQIVDSLTKSPVVSTEPYILGFAEAYFPINDKVVIRFLAEYGSFESRVQGGGNSKYGSSPDYYSRYIPPSQREMPDNGYDTAWLVVIDRTKHAYVESEPIKFNILEPENVHHPVG